MQPLAVYTTLPTREDAQRLARALVERGLVACAQITAIESCYRWQGAVQQEVEWRVLLKTSAACYDALERAIVALHSYELPAIHAMAFDRVHAPYAAWIEASTSAGGGAVEG